MTKRISYTMGENGFLTSTKTFVANGNEFRVHIYPMDGEFLIKNGTTIVVQGVGKSEANLKLKAKKALVSLGVVFDVDTRNNVAAA